MTPPSRTRLITPEDLTRLRLISSPRVSPDGRRIVFVEKHVGEKNEYATNLWQVTTDGAGGPAPFTNGGRDTQPRWSPDGSRIAFVRAAEKKRPQIHLIAADGGEATALTSFPEGSIGEIKWSPDGRSLAATFRARAEERTEAAARDRQEDGRSDPPWVTEDWWYRLDGDGYFGGDRYRLVLVDSATGEHRTLYDRDTLGMISFDFSPDSKRIAVTTNRDRKAMIRPWKAEIGIVTIATGAYRAVPGLPRGPKEAVAWSPDGKLLAYAGRVGDDSMYGTENLELWVCEPGRGRARSLTAHTDYCLMAVCVTDTAEVEFGPRLFWSPDARRVFFKLGLHGEAHLASVPVAAKEPAVTIHTRGSVDHDVGNVSRDGRRVALTRSTIDRPAEVLVAEIGGRAGGAGRAGTGAGGAARSRMLTDLNGPLLRELRLSGVTAHRVKAADGTRVHTWVMMPPDHDGGGRKKYPAILEIHGGPHAQYGFGFFHEFHVLAARGHVVFFSNPRGSKGYGRDHCAAIRGRWGDADWMDIQAVTEFMQKHPNVDARRMGIMGGSYGGYMTNWALGHTDVFAAAVTDRCVSNVVTMGGTSDFVDAPDRYFPGNFWDRPEARWEQSPIRWIGAASTPTLIIHSEGDLRCNVEQAEQLFTALKLLGVPARFVRYPRTTSHGMSRSGPPDMRLHRLHEILAWWARNLRRKARDARNPRREGATRTPGVGEARSVGRGAIRR